MRSATPSLGTSTCPMCERTYLVTPQDDCLLPECGCYGHDTSAVNPARPCRGCGTGHALVCSQMPRRLAERRAAI